PGVSRPQPCRGVAAPAILRRAYSGGPERRVAAGCTLRSLPAQGSAQRVHTEHGLVVRPNPSRLPVGRSRQGLELGDWIFIGILRVDAPAGLKGKTLALDGDALIFLTDQVHLDAAMSGIVNRFVPEGAKIEITAQFAIDARQQIEVEGGRDTGAIVV